MIAPPMISDELQEEAPGPRAAAVRDVLLAQARVVGAEEARPRDDAAHEDVDQAAEGDDREERDEERLADAPAVVVVEPVEGERARHDRHERRGARQPAQLLREDRVGLGESLARLSEAGAGTDAMRRTVAAIAAKPARAAERKSYELLMPRLGGYAEAGGRVAPEAGWDRAAAGGRIWLPTAAVAAFARRGGSSRIAGAGGPRRCQLELGRVRRDGARVDGARPRAPR